MTWWAKGLVIDVDGTLVRTEELGLSCTRAVLVKHGYSPNLVNVDLYNEGTKFPTRVRLAWHTGLDPNSAEAKALADSYDEIELTLISPDMCPLFNGIKAFLDEVVSMRGVPAVALSNATTNNTVTKLKAVGIFKYFVAVLGSDTVPETKPLPGGVIKACGLLNQPPKNCIMIGDSPSDGQAGSAAGIGSSIGVVWGQHQIETLRPHFTHIATSPSQLHQLCMSDS
ncbi:HAD family hydrolase [Pelomyxa schiedti]|nr:HAD family hydrolase [Pelomyxa schiedti]